MTEYFIIVAVSCFFAGLADHAKARWMFLVLASLSFLSFTYPAVIRYGIGTDYLGVYTHSIEAIEQGSISTDQEFSFRLVVEFVLDYLGEHHWVFVIYSVATYLVAVFSFPREGFGYAVASYLLMYYAFTLSGIRQGLALSFCLWAVVLYLRRRLFLSMAAILMAVFWHKSAVAILPLLFISDYLSRKDLPLLPLFVGMAAALLWVVDLSGIMLKAASFTPYARYLQDGGEAIGAAQPTTGLGYLIPAVMFLALSLVFTSVPGRNRQEKFIGMLCGFAVLVYGASKHVDVFNRFSIIVNAVLPFATAHLACSRGKILDRMCLAFAFLCLLLLFCKEIISDANYGIVPYTTIFDEGVSLW